MAFYGDTTKATNLAGVDLALATTEKQELVNAYIDTEIRWGGFVQSNGDEHYDIRKDFQSELVMKNHPIISVTAVYADANTDTPMLVDVSNYVFDGDSGILQLIQSKDLVTSVQKLGYFPKGYQNVHVTYVYGYSVVPDIIVKYATYVLARYLKMEDNYGKAGIIKSLKIGNYTEAYDSYSKTEWDEMLKQIDKSLKAEYASGV